MTFAFCKNRDKHVCARYLLTTRGLHVDDRTLNHPLEPRRRFEVLRTVGDQVFQFRFQIGRQAAAQLVEIDVACTHHRGRILIIDQRQKQVLERCVFMVAFIGERQCPMKGLFEAARESRH